MEQYKTFGVAVIALLALWSLAMWGSPKSLEAFAYGAAAITGVPGLRSIGNNVAKAIGKKKE